jgi:hypothetical protein
MRPSRKTPLTGPRGRPSARQEPDPVDDLLQALGHATVRLGRCTDFDPVPVIRLLRTAMEQVRAAAGVVGISPLPPGLRAWRHDLRTHVAAIAGWAVVLGQRRDEATRLRAIDAIERNAKALAELLADPPASSPPRARGLRAKLTPGGRPGAASVGAMPDA